MSTLIMTSQSKFESWEIPANKINIKLISTTIVLDKKKHALNWIEYYEKRQKGDKNSGF